MEYTVDYFIKKFEAIPEELWMVGGFTDGKRRCALGHCGCGVKFTPEASALRDIFWDCLSAFVARINDGYHPRFQQKTPRARILAALRWIKRGAK